MENNLDPNENECRTALLPFVNELRRESGKMSEKWIHVVERKVHGEVGLLKMKNESSVIISGRILCEHENKEDEENEETEENDENDRLALMTEAKAHGYECRFLRDEVNCAPVFLMWKNSRSSTLTLSTTNQFRNFQITYYDRPLELSVPDSHIRNLHETLKTKYPLLQYRINNSNEFQSVRSKQDDDITLVTAYYKISSKYSDECYKQWIAEFLKLPVRMIVFTDIVSVEDLRKLRRPYDPTVSKRTQFLVHEKEDWEVLEDVPIDVWEANVKLDAETKQVNHTAWLYALWSQKPYFVKRATDLNPFGTSWFCWTDIGSIRRPHLVNECFLFPSVDRLMNVAPQGKMIFMQLEPIRDSDRTLDVDLRLPKLIANEQSLSGPRACKSTVRIQGGFFAGPSSACQLWLERYRTVLRRFKDTGTFLGKDQNVIFTTYILYPECMTLVPARDWFQFLLDFS